MEQIKTVENILKFESELGFDLPKTYLMLLTAIGEQEQIELEDDAISIYGYTMLLERNSIYEVDKYEPNYFLIGQDGDLAVFIKKDQSENIYSCDLGALGSIEMEKVAENILFLKELE